MANDKLEVVDLAKKNYGRTWTKEMIKALTDKKLLTKQQHKEVTGDDYPETE